MNPEPRLPKNENLHAAKGDPSAKRVCEITHERCLLAPQICSAP